MFIFAGFLKTCIVTIQTSCRQKIDLNTSSFSSQKPRKRDFKLQVICN